MRYPRMSDSDEKRWLAALRAIWEMIGYDCLVATATEKNIGTKKTYDGLTIAPAEQVTLPRSHVIEIVIDQFAQGTHNQALKLDEPSWRHMRRWMMETPVHIVDKIAKKAFPEARYGA